MFHNALYETCKYMADGSLVVGGAVWPKTTEDIPYGGEEGGPYRS